jgi:hypothetical protein
MKRTARFCDMSGEEIAPATGSEVKITSGEQVFTADLSDNSTKELLETLGNPEPQKKRGAKKKAAA